MLTATWAWPMPHQKVEAASKQAIFVREKSAWPWVVIYESRILKIG